MQLTQIKVFFSFLFFVFLCLMFKKNHSSVVVIVLLWSMSQWMCFNDPRERKHLTLVVTPSQGKYTHIHTYVLVALVGLTARL